MIELTEFPWYEWVLDEDGYVVGNPFAPLPGDADE